MGQPACQDKPVEEEADRHRSASRHRSYVARQVLVHRRLPDSVTPPATEVDGPKHGFQHRLCLPDHLHVHSPARTVKWLKISLSRIDMISDSTSREGWDPRAISTASPRLIPRPRASRSAYVPDSIERTVTPSPVARTSSHTPPPVISTSRSWPSA